MFALRNAALLHPPTYTHRAVLVGLKPDPGRSLLEFSDTAEPRQNSSTVCSDTVGQAHAELTSPDR